MNLPKYLIITNNFSNRIDELEIPVKEEEELCRWIKILLLEKNRVIKRVLEYPSKKKINYKSFCNKLQYRLIISGVTKPLSVEQLSELKTLLKQYFEEYDLYQKFIQQAVDR